MEKRGWREKEGDFWSFHDAGTIFCTRAIAFMTPARSFAPVSSTDNLIPPACSHLSPAFFMVYTVFKSEQPMIKQSINNVIPSEAEAITEAKPRDLFAG